MLKLYNIYNSPADWSIKIPNKYFTELKNTQFSRGKKKKKKITQTTGEKKKKKKQAIFVLSAGKRKLQKRRGLVFFFFSFSSYLWSGSTRVAGSGHPVAPALLSSLWEQEAKASRVGFLRRGLGEARKR